MANCTATGHGRVSRGNRQLCTTVQGLGMRPEATTVGSTWNASGRTAMSVVDSVHDAAVVREVGNPKEGDAG